MLNPSSCVSWLCAAGDVPPLVVDLSGASGSGKAVETTETRKGIMNEQGAIVALEVTQNGADYTSSGLTFEYSAAIVIEALVPPRGPLSGGTEVLVLGRNFNNRSSLACRFGHHRAAARAHVYATRFVNHSAVVCVSPAVLHPGPVVLEVSNNGAGVGSSFSASNMHYHYHAPLVIQGVYPPMGPSSGNFSVRIVGGPFVESDDLRCRFGDVVVRGRYVDGEEMQCFAPPHPPGQHALEVSINNQDYSDQRFPFFYYRDMALSRLTPISGPTLAAGTPVSVYGHGFINTTLLTCRFGETVVPATFRSGSEIICHSPPLHPDSGGLTWTALSEQRNRHPDPVHGSPLLFPGANFYPLYLSRLVSVEVSNNAQDFSDSGITFLYMADAEVTAVQPSSGLDLGDTGLFVMGHNFVNSTSLRCRIGSYIVPATFITRSLVLCMTPPQPTRKPAHGFLADGHLASENMGHAPAVRVRPAMSGPSDVFVEVSNNGMDFTSNRKVFHYEGPCPTGFFCPMNDIKCKMACPKGTYCPGEGNTNFTLCPRGTYQSLEGQSSCFRCPIGFACPEMGLYVPRICPAGMFTPSSFHKCLLLSTHPLAALCVARFRVRRDGHGGGQPAVSRGALLPRRHGHHSHHVRSPTAQLTPLPCTITRRAAHDAPARAVAPGSQAGARCAQPRVLEQQYHGLRSAGVGRAVHLLAGAEADAAGRQLALHAHPRALLPGRELSAAR